MMEYRYMQSLDRDVSALGFGAWAIGGDRVPLSYGPTNDEDSSAALETALQHGVNLIDTADCYGGGHSEELIGRVLLEFTDDIPVLVTKVGNNWAKHEKNYSFGYAAAALEESAKRLGHRPDVVLFHNPNQEHYADRDFWLDLEQLKAEGLVTAVGVSFRKVLPDAISIPLYACCDVIEIPFSGIRQEAITYMGMWCARGIDVLLREPLGNGFLALKHTPYSTFPETDFRGMVTQQQRFEMLAQSYLFHANHQHAQPSPVQAAIQFALTAVYGASVLVGCKNAEQARENFTAVA